MKRFLYILTVLVFLTGCGSLFQSRWTNFTAYYNTFYNARQSYETGLEKVLSADISYNPQLPIRIHEAPINAGAQDFQKAIEKSAEILRKFPESKWVDDALFLIARSYYFRSDFFSADQKYQELYRVTEDPSLKQQAVIWRGRLLLDMDLPLEGINYVNASLYNNEINWLPEEVAQARAVLAELYVAAGEYDLAIYELESSLYLLDLKKYKERGFFLLGQLYDLTGDQESALYAYEQVGQYYSDYELQYLSRRKRAETARAIGAYDQAVRTLENMVRDDKNTEFRAELDYELARTLQESREFEEARDMYRRILYEGLNRPNRIILAKTYNGLAEVYEFGFNDYRLAAAYYDSAAQQNVAPEFLPPGFKARELSQYFGEYVLLKDEIHRKDSLLWVAGLDRSELDALVIEIRRKKLLNLEEERRRQEQEQNTLVNINNQASGSTTGESGSFLNYNNPSLKSNSEVQFYSMWGDRPLVDNWRVEALFESEHLISESGVVRGPSGPADNLVSVDLSIDLSEVPFRPEQQDSMRNDLAGLNFELGNLFYLSLLNADSAAHYFERVILHYPESEEAPISYYSLSELYRELNDMDQSEFFARELIQRFPETEFASRVAEVLGLDIDSATTSSTDLLSLARMIVADSSTTALEKGKSLSALYQDHPDHPEAGELLFESILRFTEAGKESASYQEHIHAWVRKQSNEQDSVSAVNPDPDLFPFYGEAWDSARVHLLDFMDSFKESPRLNRARRLYDEIKLPEGRALKETSERLDQ